jgi:hypothetical protein
MCELPFNHSINTNENEIFLVEMMAPYGAYGGMYYLEEDAASMQAYAVAGTPLPPHAGPRPGPMPYPPPMPVPYITPPSPQQLPAPPVCNLQCLLNQI